MRRNLVGIGLTAVLAASLAVSAWVVADDAPGANPNTPTTNPHQKARPTTRTAMIRLNQPYSKMTDLTPDERAKIYEIHEAMLKKVHELEVQERADIEAVLTDPQKTELLEIEAKDKAARNEHAHHPKKATTHPATAPAAG